MDFDDIIEMTVGFCCILFASSIALFVGGLMIMGAMVALDHTAKAMGIEFEPEKIEIVSTVEREG